MYLGTNHHAGLEDCCCIAMNWKAVWLTDCKGFKRAIRRGQVFCDNLYSLEYFAKLQINPFWSEKSPLPNVQDMEMLDDRMLYTCCFASTIYTTSIRWSIQECRLVYFISMQKAFNMGLSSGTHCWQQSWEVDLIVIVAGLKNSVRNVEKWSKRCTNEEFFSLAEEPAFQYASSSAMSGIS